MADKPGTGSGYDREDSYFYEKDLALLAKRRAELDAVRNGSASGTLKCPRCGAEMMEVAIDHVKADRCGGCGGIFLDKGELEILTMGRFGGFFKRLFRHA